ncbi:nucleotidyltransferase family protein [Amycolatopsis endophytica]|uniref:dTDP-glucose pyrophosphorylase n=2 Tax=Amycolatopsis endophytica TaxID=860233 RepID=A0A853AZP3_9PSEU|nr:dTDP-glucose pyrophosphorylase [Amycolatopsis endophytica]
MRDAFTVVDMNDLSDVFVVDDSTRLVGAVSEQDLRRALLGGVSLDDPITPLVRPWRATANQAADRAAVLDLMRALGVRNIPVVDSVDRVIGLHVERRIIGVPKLPNWAVIMAGGKGTRLGSLTKTVPKPMLTVAGRPILERLVLHLVGSGVEKIFLSVNYLANIIEKHFGDGGHLGCSIEYLREDPDVPLGTGGALRLLGDLGYQADYPLLVMNGDLVTNFSVSGLLEAHRKEQVLATIATSTYHHEVPFGVLRSERNQLTRIVEKPIQEWPVNAGIYTVDPVLIGRIPVDQEFPITRLFEDCLSRGEKVGLWPLRDDWQDIGRPNELAQARGQ